MESAEDNASDGESPDLERNRQDFDENRDEILTSAISNDGILTRQPQADRQSAGADSVRLSDDAARSDATETAGAAADLERAQQRLAQETGRAGASVPENPDQARALVQRLSEQITADPRAALRATDRISDTLFEAATARPTT